MYRVYICFSKKEKMRGSSAFKRSGNQGQYIDVLNYVSRIQVRPCEKIKGTSQNRKKEGEELNARGKTANRKQSKMNIKPHLLGKQVEKEKKSIVYGDFEHFEKILASECYQKLNKEYSILKKEISASGQKIKDQILELNRDIRREESRLTDLANLKQSLTSEVNYLGQLHQDLRLKNYELRCQLYRERGFGQQNYYDSQQDIELSQMDYQQMMELQAQMGVVQVGFKEEQIKKMKGYSYRRPKRSSEDEKCCICYEDFEETQQVYKTKCGHLHHLECLGKWLKIKRECPLCRGGITELK